MKLQNSLETATQTLRTLLDTKLLGVTPPQLRRYGYMLLRVESDLQDTLEYITDLLLCSGRGGELCGRDCPLSKMNLPPYGGY